MAESPHPDAEQEARNSNEIPLMSMFPASKLFQCQFCPKVFLTERARKQHNDMKFRDYAIAQMEMDEAEGARDRGSSRVSLELQWMKRKKHPLQRELAPHP